MEIREHGFEKRFMYFIIYSNIYEFKKILANLEKFIVLKKVHGLDNNELKGNKKERKVKMGKEKGNHTKLILEQTWEKLLHKKQVGKLNYFL